MGSRSSPSSIDPNDVYSYALRAAYLSYLLQPRKHRTVQVPSPQQIQRPSTSINDLMKDFNLVREPKSTKLPRDFMGEFEKRLRGVVMGKEKLPGYNEATIKRSIGSFYNTFTEPSRKKRFAQDRKVEELLLIMLTSATKELRKGTTPDDEGTKFMVERHVALFLRLISSTLRDHDWTRDRPELANNLAVWEKKLLAHDDDLTAGSIRSSGSRGATIEVAIPLSNQVKDMPLVQSVARIFGVTESQAQSDINKGMSSWTEKAALADLKSYQNFLSLNSRKTLNSDDFDLEEAYDAWKKAEIPVLSQMMLKIMQSHPELAKSTTGLQASHQNPHLNGAPESGYLSMNRNFSENNEENTGYVIDQPVDVSGFNLRDDNPDYHKDEKTPFTFIPPDPRAYFRYMLKQTLTKDLQEQARPASESGLDFSFNTIISKQSLDLLSDISERWRIPHVSRSVLFLDSIREKFVEQEIDLDTLDNAFTIVNDPVHPSRKGSSPFFTAPIPDKSKWTISDFALSRQLLSVLHDALLRDLYEVMQHCYESKPPTAGPILYILDTHIYSDELFSKSKDDVEGFSEQLKEGLAQKAAEAYQGFLEKDVPSNQDEWEFYHIIQLGKSILKLSERIQKRYKKNPEIMGVNPLTILVTHILPAYEQDACDMATRIINVAVSKSMEIDIQDGFELYKEFVNVRGIHHQILPSIPFAFSVEDLLEEFVWRWIRITDSKIVDLTDQAILQDQFRVRSEANHQDSSDDERHSVSVIDLFRIFNETINQISTLEWNDHLQHAKFMTALSRTIGKGLARYCEVVELKFSKEMDRLSPEQEAAAGRTRQERWMQLAKDAWNNKDRVEPFQFFPESFVKLNNVEFATYQLDRLEKTINVDGCAEIIQKNSPPIAQRQRKTSNYVFTIKIVEAEDLKACDINGLSDPYVVLGDEYQKRLAKTRIIYGNLNPRWDETVDLTTQGPLNIIATVWDWDTLGDHDCVGRTSIKLDPSHFSDYMPREYWLDLDTQGRLLLRVSMEGERDDIQFYFGKAFRTLKRTERDMTRTITDKLSAYISHCLSRGTLRNLLSKGITMSSVTTLFARNRPQSTQPGVTQAELSRALSPLFAYFDDNFAIMKQTLTDAAMIKVMTRLWKEVLNTIEALLLPPLSDKPSQQRPLNQQELDVVFKWLQLLFDFFHAVDEESGIAHGVSLDVLKSPKYHEIKSLNFFYFESTDNLIRISEGMASATALRHANAKNRLSAPAHIGEEHSFGGAMGMMGMTSTRRTKSIMLSRNLGTMKKAKEEKRKEAQAETNDDMILRILRMRPEATTFLKDRSKQKERLAAVAAAEMIVRQSLTAGGGRMAANLPRY
ncbi:MAG: hypothetical protein M1829_002769 [Trizodia sp. TS-e1964]|nr:MAG: hypothetical protein M1829_002769 [Trizodia sp. TS-e1964]